MQVLLEAKSPNSANIDSGKLQGTPKFLFANYLHYALLFLLYSFIFLPIKTIGLGCQLSKASVLKDVNTTQMKLEPLFRP